MAIQNMPWPESLPQQFEKDGYGDAFADNRHSTQPDLGPALIRSRISSMPRRVRGTMKMNKTQLNRLRQFWKVDTLDGKLPFLFPDPIFGYGYRKNWIPTSSYAGAVIGVDVNPGTLPTDWTGVGTENGIWKRVAGVGIENDLEYVDIQFSGTPTGVDTTNYADIIPCSSPYISSAVGQVWTFSSYVRMVFGSKINLTRFYMMMNDYPSAADSVAKDILPLLTTSELKYQRYDLTWTPQVAGMSAVIPRFRIYGTVGIFIDITLRIAGVQMEKLAAPSAFMETPNDSTPITRFAADGTPPQPSFLGGDTWAVNMELEIFEV